MTPSMNEALSIIARAFPGVRVMPQTYPTHDLAECIGCGHATILRDASGVPWHEKCLERSSPPSAGR